MNKFVLYGAFASVYALLLRPQMMRWGAEPDEMERRYPGDNLISTPNLQATRAATIAAPTSAVWPWLAQMGRERSGFYGIDRLDNWNIPSVRYVRHDMAPLAPGIMLDHGLKVLEFETERYLLIGGFDMPNDLGSKSDSTYLYHLEARPGDHCRLVVHTRIYSEGWRGWLYNRLYEPMDFLMGTAQLKGIQERAEATQHPPKIERIPLSRMDSSG